MSKDKNKQKHLEDPKDVQSTKLEEISHFSVGDMQSAWEFFPSDYAIASEGLLDANRNLHTAEVGAELLGHKLYMQFRSEAELTGAKTTEKTLSAKVAIQPTAIQAKEMVDSAKEVVERYKSALKVLDKKERAMEIVSRFQIKELGSLGRT